MNANFQRLRVQGSDRDPLYLLRACHLFFYLGVFTVTFEQLRPFEFAISDIFILISTVLLLCSVIIYQRFSPRISVLFIPPLLILVGSAFSLLNAYDLTDAWTGFSKVIILYAIFAPTAFALSRQIKRILLLFMTGVAVNCSMALLGLFAVPSLVSHFEVNPISISEYAYGLPAVRGLTGFPNHLAQGAAIAAVFALGLFYWGGSWQTRFISIVVLVLYAGTAVLTGARAFVAVFVPGALVFLILQKISPRLITLMGIGLIVGIIGLEYVPPEYTERYRDRLVTTGAGQGSDVIRLELAEEAWSEIWEKPLLGWGVDRIGEGGSSYVGEALGAHNAFLQYWFALGLIGGVGLFSLFGITGWQIWRALRLPLSPNEVVILRSLLAAELAVFIVANLALVVFNRYVYLPTFVSGGYASYLLHCYRTRPSSGYARVRVGRPIPSAAFLQDQGG